MGALLNTYLAQFGNSLAEAAGQQQQLRGRNATRGPAQTFPISGPGAQSAPPLNVSGPTFVEPQPPIPPPVGATFENAPTPAPQAGPTPAFEQPQLQQIDVGQIRRRRRRDIKPEDVKDFDDLMDAASDDEIRAGIDVIEQQVGGPEGLRRAYSQVTGQPPDDRLTREDMGMLLMEFGLRTLAYNDQAAGSLGAVGRAGAETLGMARDIRQGKREAPARQQEAELKNRLLEAQIAKAEADPTEIRSDANGNLVLINKQSGSSQAILDAAGNPVTEGQDAATFASQIDRQAYEAAFCEGMSGDEMRSCKQRALAFSKGGAAEIAFPELQRQNLVERLITRLEDSDNQSNRYTLPNGETKRWREMTPDEQLEVTNTLIDKYVSVIQSQPTQTNQQTGAAVEVPSWAGELGFTSDQLAQIPDQNRVPFTNQQGEVVGYVANRGEQYVRLGPDGQPVQ